MLANRPITIDQYNDGPNVWLYDEAFTERLLAAEIPSGRWEPAGPDEQQAAARGEALCVLTDDDFGGCQVRRGVPGAEEAEQLCLMDTPTSGVLNLQSGRLRLDGPNWLRIDAEIAADIADAHSESASIEVEPGWYRIDVYRLDEEAYDALPRKERRKLSDEAVLICLSPCTKESLAADQDFYLGFPPVVQRAIDEEFDGLQYTGRMSVFGVYCQMNLPTEVRAGLGLTDGTLLRFESRDEPANHILGIVHAESYVDPSRYSRRLKQLVEQEDFIALIHPEEPLFRVFDRPGSKAQYPFTDGDHIAIVSLATIELDGSELTGIAVTAEGDEGWLDVPESNGIPAVACDELLGVFLAEEADSFLLQTWALEEGRRVLAVVQAFKPGVEAGQTTAELSYQDDMPEQVEFAD